MSTVTSLSSKMLQPSIISQSTDFIRAATSPRSVVSFSVHMIQQSDATFLLIIRDRYFDFMELPLEVFIILLGEIAAEQLLPLFRSLCQRFHDIVATHQSPIVTAAFRNGRYRTVSKLYYPHIFSPRPPPMTLHVNDLYLLACRCDSARKLAHLLAEHHVIDLIRASQHSGIAPSQACSITQISDNIYPYVIGLFHFMDSYRSALATSDHHDDSHKGFAQIFSSRTEIQLLAQYNNLTVYRLCYLYNLLLRIVQQKIPSVGLACLPRRLGLPYRCMSYLDIFIFGGLEAVSDVMVKRSIRIRVEHLRAHYSKSAANSLSYSTDRAYTSSVILPKAILPWLDDQMTSDLCRRLPPAAYFLHPWDTGLSSFPLNVSQDVADGEFLEYLATHDGAEPKLLQ